MIRVLAVLSALAATAASAESCYVDAGDFRIVTDPGRGQGRAIVMDSANGPAILLREFGRDCSFKSRPFPASDADLESSATAVFERDLSATAEALKILARDQVELDLAETGQTPGGLPYRLAVIRQPKAGDAFHSLTLLSGRTPVVVQGYCLLAPARTAEEPEVRALLGSVHRADLPGVGPCRR